MPADDVYFLTTTTCLCIVARVCVYSHAHQVRIELPDGIHLATDVTII